MKKIFILISMMFFVAACSKALQNIPTASDKDNYHTVCQQLNQQLIFSSNDPNADIHMNSPTQKARLLQEYKKYNCDTEVVKQ